MSGQNTPGEASAFLSKIDNDVNDLKSEAKITGFKIYRLEKSMDDMKAVLERLTDVYHNQSMIQKDIVSIYKELAEIKSATLSDREVVAPLRDTVTTHITTVKTTARISILIGGVLYAIGGWAISEALSYGRDVTQKTEAIEKHIVELQHQRMATDTALSELKNLVLVIQRDGKTRIESQ